jgi:hypothetical protein
MVEEGVADALVENLKARVSKLTVGKPEDDCDICHVISKASADWIEALVTGAHRPCWNAPPYSRLSVRFAHKYRRIAIHSFEHSMSGLVCCVCTFDSRELLSA